MPTTRQNNCTTIKRGRPEKEELVVKPSSIRIWIHERDVFKLWQVLLAGQGARLLREISSHPKVKKFLEMVPYIMNHIRDIHLSAIENKIEDLRVNLAHPVPQSLSQAKDQNGLTIIHKAAGLGHCRILQLLAETLSDCLNDKDGTGKTPLHWAASAKNSNFCYNLLVSAGSREDILDFNMKTPIYYRGKPHEINRPFLTILPEAPRVPDKKRTDWSVIVIKDELTSIASTFDTQQERNERNRQKQKSMDEFVFETGGDENIVENNQLKNSFSNGADYVSQIKSEVGNGDRLMSGGKVESHALLTELGLPDFHEAEGEADVPKEFSVANTTRREDEKLIQLSIEEADKLTNQESHLGVLDTEIVSSVDDFSQKATYTKAGCTREAYPYRSNDTDECPHNTQQEQHDKNKCFEESKHAGQDTTKILNDIGDNRNSSRYFSYEDKNDDDQAKRELQDENPRSLNGWDIQGIIHDGPDFALQSPVQEIDREDVSQSEWIVDDGDMEKLATIVLNGDGLKLIGAKAKHPDVQAFLDNVNVYMSKIRQVHLAARTGNLLDMQSALDRRKFATAKDEISPSGASPLHVATLFGHSNNFYASTQDIYLETVEKVNDLLNTMQRTTFITPQFDNQHVSSPALSQPITRTSQDPRLPRINLPNFNGKYGEWLNFKDLFSSIVVANQSISNSGKLYYLKCCLKGTAAQLFKTASSGEDNFHQAWDAVTSFYDSRRILVSANLDSFFNIKEIKEESAKELERLYTSTTQIYRTLQNLKVPVEYWSDILVHIVVRKKIDSNSTSQTNVKNTTLQHQIILVIYLKNHIILESVLFV